MPYSELNYEFRRQMMYLVTQVWAPDTDSGVVSLYAKPIKWCGSVPIWIRNTVGIVFSGASHRFYFCTSVSLPGLQEHQHQGEVRFYRVWRGRGCGGRCQRTRRKILQRRQVRYPVPRVQDPNRIRIQSGQWIRIRYSESGSESRRAKITY